MGLWTRLFGQSGTVRFGYISYQGNGVAEMKVKDFNIDDKKLKQHLKQMLFDEHSITSTDIKILEFIED